MATMIIAWTENALSDLRRAREYLLINDRELIAVTAIKLKKALELLSAHPEMGRIGRIKDTRELLLTGTSFLLPYRVKLENIEILAFMHARRRWPKKY